MDPYLFGKHMIIHGMECIFPTCPDNQFQFATTGQWFQIYLFPIYVFQANHGKPDFFVHVPLFTNTQETLIQSWVYSFGAPFRGVILNDGILTMTSWALGWPSGNWTVRHGKSPCSIGKSSNDGPFSLATLVYVSLLEANGFVFESGVGLPHCPAKRIHPRSMKLESCYHGDPWISFLGFEATATSTSTSFFGDFRDSFPMWSLYFFPTKLGALGFSTSYRVQ